MRIGTPIEAVLIGPETLLTHIAGTVAYCRPAGGEYYEIGVQVRASGPRPILLGDLEAAKSQYRWFAEALGDRRHAGGRASGRGYAVHPPAMASPVGSGVDRFARVRTVRKAP